jgi:hypothetical protein
VGVRWGNTYCRKGLPVSYRNGKIRIDGKFIDARVPFRSIITNKGVNLPKADLRALIGTTISTNARNSFSLRRTEHEAIL